MEGFLETRCLASSKIAMVRVLSGERIHSMFSAAQTAQFWKSVHYKYIHLYMFVCVCCVMLCVKTSQPIFGQSDLLNDSWIYYLIKIELRVNGGELVVAFSTADSRIWPSWSMFVCVFGPNGLAAASQQRKKINRYVFIALSDRTIRTTVHTAWALATITAVWCPAPQRIHAENWTRLTELAENSILLEYSMLRFY